FGRSTTWSQCQELHLAPLFYYDIYTSTTPALWGPPTGIGRDQGAVMYDLLPLAEHDSDPSRSVRGGEAGVPQPPPRSRSSIANVQPSVESTAAVAVYP